MNKGFATALILLCALALAGCKQVLYSRLSEQEANNVLLALIKGGVKAEKHAIDDKTFSVLVPESELATAIELLKAGAEPAEHYANLGEVFKRNSLISSPMEERVRLVYGLQQELSRTLSEIDGVLTARVHIVIPASDPFDSQIKPSSASVFLKHRADMDMQAVVPSVKDLVVRSIEGLRADGVSVTLFPAQATLTAPDQVPVTRFFGALVAPASVSRLWVLFTIPWLLAAALAVMLLHAARIRDVVADAAKVWRHQRHESRGRPPIAQRSDDDVAPASPGRRIR